MEENMERRQIPDAQIKDAADQYEEARRVLSKQPPLSGVLWPQMNVAAVAIELYLKCLNAKKIYTPIEDNTDGLIVTAKNLKFGHGLEDLFKSLSEKTRNDLEFRYGQLNTGLSQKTVLDILISVDGAFQKTRYPFDSNDPSEGYKTLMFISNFLSDFVEDIETEEFIEWS